MLSKQLRICHDLAAVAAMRARDATHACEKIGTCVQTEVLVYNIHYNYNPRVCTYRTSFVNSCDRHCCTFGICLRYSAIVNLCCSSACITYSAGKKERAFPMFLLIVLCIVVPCPRVLSLVDSSRFRFRTIRVS